MTLFTPRSNPVDRSLAGIAAVAICGCILGAGTVSAEVPPPATGADADPPMSAISAISAVSAESTDGVDSLELQELKTAVAVLQKQLEAERERNAGRLPASAEENDRRQVQAQALAESLAEANRVAERLRADYEDLLLRMASLGVDLLKPDPKSLEQRLLKAVRERDLAEQEKEELAGQLLRLSEAAGNFVRFAISGDENLQSLLEEQVEQANRVLGLTTAAPVRETALTLSEGRVVSVDPEIGLIVLNVGRESGVRIGMPLQILRADRPVGIALVIDARDTVSGAVLQSLVAVGDDAKVGDRIKPQTMQF